MKKITFAASSVLSFLTPSLAFAQNVTITKPPQGFPSIGNFITNTLTIAFLVALLVVLAMLIWGAFEWITSGGGREAVGKARGRIINALIGLAVLAIAFALARVAAQFLGFPDITQGIPIPTPGQPVQGQF